MIRLRKQGKNRNRLSNLSLRKVFLRIRALHRSGCPWPEVSAFLYWSEGGRSDVWASPLGRLSSKVRLTLRTEAWCFLVLLIVCQPYVGQLKTADPQMA